MGGAHACGIDNADHTIVHCWGWNGHQQLAPLTSTSSAAAIATFSSAVNIISSGYYVSIAVAANNVVYIWGRN
eukprot:202468-Rhodomonas_salina.1